MATLCVCRLQSFVWGNSLISAMGKDGFFYLQDHLGSPIRLLDDAGMGEAIAYDEFEKIANKTSSAFENPFAFTGYQSDLVSGMYYAQARYYDPRISRMISQDPHWHPGNTISRGG